MIRWWQWLLVVLAILVLWLLVGLAIRPLVVQDPPRRSRAAITTPAESLHRDRTALPSGGRSTLDTVSYGARSPSGYRPSTREKRAANTALTNATVALGVAAPACVTISRRGSGPRCATACIRAHGQVAPAASRAGRDDGQARCAPESV